MPTMVKRNIIRATAPGNKIADELDIDNKDEDTGTAGKKGMNGYVSEEPHMNDANNDEDIAPAKNRATMAMLSML
jgi:hypothetical protein